MQASDPSWPENPLGGIFGVTEKVSGVQRSRLERTQLLNIDVLELVAQGGAPRLTLPEVLPCTTRRSVG